MSNQSMEDWFEAARALRPTSRDRLILFSERVGN
jgi:hypothetical protein